MGDAAPDMYMHRGCRTIEQLELQRAQLIQKRANFSAMVECADPFVLPCHRSLPTRILDEAKDVMPLCRAPMQDKVRAGEQASAKMGRQIKDIIERVTAANQQS